MFVTHDNKENNGYVSQIESLEEIGYGGLPFAVFATNLLGEDSDNGFLTDFFDNIYGGHQGDSEEGLRYIGLFSGTRPLDRDKEPGQPNKKPLQETKEEYYLYPQEMDEAERWILRESQKGREVYCCAHLLSDSKRTKENAARITALYADGDGAKIPEGMPQPTLTVESSPGRHHYYWRLTKPLPPEEAEELNKRLTHAIGADKGGYDLTQVLRPPGTTNHKYDDLPVVELIEVKEDEAYDPDELDRILPPIEKPVENGSQIGNAPSEEQEEEYVEPPVVLDDYGMQVWSGEKVKRYKDGSPDHSASLYHIGGVLYDAGATRGIIVEALKERDSTLGWKTYSGRKDDGEYERIFKKLEEKGRNSRGDSSPAETKSGHPNSGSGLGERMLLGEAFRNGKEPPEETVKDVLLKGYVHQVYSQGGIGKTFLALHVTRDVIDQGGTVVYLDRENGPRVMMERLIENLGVDPDDVDKLLHYYPAPELDMSPGSAEGFLEKIEELAPALVVFDSFIDFLAYAGLDDNSPTDVAKWFVKYIHPLKKLGVTVLILDHTNKTDESDSRGAGQKRNEVDVQWHLKRKKGFSRSTMGELTLSRKKDRHGWLPEEVSFDIGGTDDGFVFEKTGTKGKAEEDLSPNQKKILGILRDQFGDKGALYNEWMKACENKGVNENTFKKCREVLLGGKDKKRKKYVTKEGDRYFPVDG